ncbi:MAG TPA: hypothetical protein VGD64_07535 [Acidisarcina sp.]
MSRLVTNPRVTGAAYSFGTPMLVAAFAAFAFHPGRNYWYAKDDPGYPPFPEPDPDPAPDPDPVPLPGPFGPDPGFPDAPGFPQPVTV